MFVVTLSKASVKKLGVGAMCCALVVFQRHAGAVHQHPLGGCRGGKQ